MLLLAAPATFAWGPQGHRLVGDLAEAELNARARAEVSKLLTGEATPTLAGVANWADELRDADPALYRRTARWHYVNLGEHGCTYQAARDCPNGDCVVEAIRTQLAILANRSEALAKRRDALKFVVHFVGDIHQPLHAGHAHDRGGNDHQVNDAGFGSNLHALWDSRLFYRQRLDDRAYLARLAALPLAVPITSTPADWAEASCRVVLQDGFYPARSKLEDDYFQQWTPVAEARLRAAGSQLAALINHALGQTTRG